jgi:hypothetical protein
MNTAFVVENGINTSYIDTLLFSLFYNIHCNDLLIELPENERFGYLQDLILDNFIYPIRNGHTVTANIINEIRNYSYLCGWKNNSNILELFDTCEYFDFLMNGITKKIINIDIKINDKNIKNITMNYLTFNIEKNTNVKILLNKWQKNNFYFREIPFIVPIYLNRKYESSYNHNKIDIKKKIKFNNDKINSWTIYSIICYVKSIDHNIYYSLILYDNTWYLFNNLNYPALSKIDITDNDIKFKIMQECVMLFYRLI